MCQIFLRINNAQYNEVLVCTHIFYSPKPQKGHNPNNYGRALMSAIPQAITPNPHSNLLNVYIQIANKMGFQPIYIQGVSRL
jgi:hypothetical protein